MIEGVKTKQLKVINDGRGWLMEILRCDEAKFFEKFGQVYLTTAYPDVVKAWHMHKIQTDNFACIHGMMQVVLYDGRVESKTMGQVEEFFIGDRNPMLISVPPLVYHGFKAIGPETAYFLSVPTEPYNYKTPDEYRLPPDTNEIPFNWILDPAKKHG